MKKFCYVVFSILVFTGIESRTFAQESGVTNSAAADAAWKNLENATRPPVPPAEWGGKQPTEEQLATFRATQRKLAGAAADQAKDFHTRFPEHPKADEAREKEKQMVGFAVQLGDTNRVAQLKQLSSDVERFAERWEETQLIARAKGREATLNELERGARALQKDFPKQLEIFEIWMMLLSSTEGEQARRIANDLVNSSAPEEIKMRAQGVLKKMDALGKPLSIQFTATDGRQVDLTKFRGKVVLIDFWATWCGPCVAAMPQLKEAYEKLGPKGFEIIGINLDEDKAQMQNFVTEEKINWPHYFDGLKWKNKFAVEFGVNSLPALWLVDKKGVLRDLNAHGDFLEKVEKLMAE